MTPPLLLVSEGEYRLPSPPSTTFGYWVRDRETGMNTLLEVSELTQTTLWKSSLVIQIKNHKMSLPFDQYFHSRKLFKIWGKPYVWRFFNALLFIIGKTKEEKLLKYPKIAKCLSKFWSIHMVEKYTHTKQLKMATMLGLEVPQWAKSQTEAGCH